MVDSNRSAVRVPRLGDRRPREVAYRFPSEREEATMSPLARADRHCGGWPWRAVLGPERGGICHALLITVAETAEQNVGEWDERRRHVVRVADCEGLS